MEKTYKLTEPQYQFLINPARHKAFISGIGAGKTVVGVIHTIKEAVEQPGSRGVIIAPSYPLLRDVILYEFYRWVPEEIIYEYNETKKIIKLINGSQILFRSASDNQQIERLRGLTIAWAWIDECTLIRKAIWDIILGRLRQPGFQHKIWITGTPKGFDWTYDIFVRDPIPDSFILYGVSSATNPFLPEGYVDHLRTQYSNQFALQEIEGLYVKFEGLVYPDFDPGKHILKKEGAKKFQNVFYGLDFGYRNPTCLLAIGVSGNQLYVLDEFYAPRITDDELLTVLAVFQKNYGVGRIYCDPSEPGSIEKLRKNGFDAVAGDNNIKEGIRTVNTFISNDQLFVYERCQNFINEIQSYRYDENDKETPIKLNDHAMDALRYAIYTHLKSAWGDLERYKWIRAR